MSYYEIHWTQKMGMDFMDMVNLCLFISHLVGRNIWIRNTLK